MCFDCGVTPYLLPELGGFRYTPRPEVMVIRKGDAMLLAHKSLKVKHLRLLWGRRLPDWFYVGQASVAKGVHFTGEGHLVGNVQLFKKRMRTKYVSIDVEILDIG
jgi:hypothetical protein